MTYSSKLNNSAMKPPRKIKAFSSDRAFTITHLKQGADLVTEDDKIIGGAFQKIGTQGKNEDAIGMFDFPLAMFSDTESVAKTLTDVTRKIAENALAINLNPDQTLSKAGGSTLNITVVGTTPEKPNQVMSAQLGDSFVVTGQKQVDNSIVNLQERTPSHNISSGAGKYYLKQLQDISDWFEEKEGYIASPASNSMVQMVKGLGDADIFALNEAGKSFVTQDEQQKIFELRSTPDIVTFDLPKDNVLAVCTDGFVSRRLSTPANQACIVNEGKINGKTACNLTTLYNMRGISSYCDDQSVSLIDASQLDNTQRGIAVVTLDGHSTHAIQPMAIQTVFKEFEDLYQRFSEKT